MSVNGKTSGTGKAGTPVARSREREARWARGAGAMFLLLAAWAPLLCAQPSPGSLDTAQIEETRRLRQEISLLNLLNGLYLSPEQLGQLVPLAEKAAAIHQQYRQTYATESGDYARELSALRDGLYGATGATPEQKGPASARHHRLDSLLRQKMTDELLPLEEEARRVLNEAQLAIIQDFKPCLTPPKNLSDPVAVGQVNTTEREEAMLDIVRRMPPALYADQRARIAEAIVNQQEMMKGKLGADVRAATQATFGRRMDEARMLSDVEYALRKKDLARSFQVYDDKVVFRQGQRQTGPVAAWLLGADSAAILKRWRDARQADPVRTEVANASETDTRVRRAAQLDSASLAYGGATWRMLQERGNRLAEAERREMGKVLQELKKLPTPAERVAAVDPIVARLNAVALTKGSVDAQQAKLAYLCLDRRVPNVSGARRADLPVLEDLTGLSARVVRARECSENGKFKEAHAALSAVAEHIGRFRN